MTTREPKPYGFKVVFERAKANGGMCPVYEEVTITRKGTEHAARRAAALTRGFRSVLSVTPISQDEAPTKRTQGEETGPLLAPVPTPELQQPTERTPLNPDEAEEAAVAIKSVIAAVAELAVIAVNKRKHISAIQEGLAVVERLLPQNEIETSDATKLLKRCERLTELFNIEELESWKISVDRMMEAAWRRLPL